MSQEGEDGLALHRESLPESNLSISYQNSLQSKIRVSQICD